MVLTQVLGCAVTLARSCGQTANLPNMFYISYNGVFVVRSQMERGERVFPVTFCGCGVSWCCLNGELCCLFCFSTLFLPDALFPCGLVHVLHRGLLLCKSARMGVTLPRS